MERRKGSVESTLEAFRLPLHPVPMVCISFVFGASSFLVAQGAGAASRQKVDAALFGGMIAAMALTVLFDSGLFRHIPGAG